MEAAVNANKTAAGGIDDNSLQKKVADKMVAAKAFSEEKAQRSWGQTSAADIIKNHITFVTEETIKKKPDAVEKDIVEAIQGSAADLARKLVRNGHYEKEDAKNKGRITGDVKSLLIADQIAGIVDAADTRGTKVDANKIKNYIDDNKIDISDAVAEQFKTQFRTQTVRGAAGKAGDNIAVVYNSMLNKPANEVVIDYVNSFGKVGVKQKINFANVDIKINNTNENLFHTDFADAKIAAVVAVKDQMAILAGVDPVNAGVHNYTQADVDAGYEVFKKSIRNSIDDKGVVKKAIPTNINDALAALKALTNGAAVAVVNGDNLLNAISLFEANGGVPEDKKVFNEVKRDLTANGGLDFDPISKKLFIDGKDNLAGLLVRNGHKSLTEEEIGKLFDGDNKTAIALAAEKAISDVDVKSVKGAIGASYQVIAGNISSRIAPAVEIAEYNKMRSFKMNTPAVEVVNNFIADLASEKNDTGVAKYADAGSIGGAILDGENLGALAQRLVDTGNSAIDESGLRDLLKPSVVTSNINKARDKAGFGRVVVADMETAVEDLAKGTNNLAEKLKAEIDSRAILKNRSEGFMRTKTPQQIVVDYFVSLAKEVDKVSGAGGYKYSNADDIIGAVHHRSVADALVADGYGALS